MTEKEKNSASNEVDWDRVLSGESEEKPSTDQLLDQMRRMKTAADAIPRGTRLVQLFAVLMIMLYSGVIVTQVQSPYILYVFIIIAPTITIMIHYIVVIEKLRRLTRG